jgi:hypothetical protein
MYLPAFRSPTMTNIAISKLRQPPMRPTCWFYNQTRGMENRILDKKLAEGGMIFIYNWSYLSKCDAKLICDGYNSVLVFCL